MRFPSYHCNQLNPATLKIGDKVEVCFCDTSAVCVWSYPGEVATDSDGDICVVSNEVNYQSVKVSRMDGCYVYLIAQRLRSTK